MGYYKYLKISFLNKRHFFLIKTYSFYKKDIWDSLRVKRSVNYKKAIYSILKTKRKFYHRILYMVYKGIKFHTKYYNYKANLLFTKKRLKLFYGFLRDTYLGKLGLLVKRRMGDIVNYFYSIIERRLDVLVYRSLYSLSVQFSRYFICNRGILVNNKLARKPNRILRLGDVIIISAIPFNFFFFRFMSDKSIDTYRLRFKMFYLVRSKFYQWRLFKAFRIIIEHFMPIEFKRYRRSENNILYMIYLFYSWFYKFLWYVIKKTVYYRSHYKRRSRFFKNMVNKDRKLKFLPLILPVLLVNNFSKFVQLLINLRRFRSVRRFYQFSMFRLYGLVNFRIRVRKFFFLIRPRWFNKPKSQLYLVMRNKLLIKKRFRYWPFSKAVYEYLKEFDQLSYVYKGYPSYVEVSYRAHILLLYREPSVLTVYYPFHFNKVMLYDYFKLKSYF